MKNIYYKNNYKHNKTISRKVNHIFILIDDLKRMHNLIDIDLMNDIKDLIKLHANQSNINNIQYVFNVFALHAYLFMVFAISLQAILFYNLPLYPILKQLNKALAYINDKNN